MNNIEITGLWVPLITPMYHGSIDIDSFKPLINSIEPFVDGYVPCLSSGEGNLLSDDSCVLIVQEVLKHTDKPIFSGVKRPNLEETITLGKAVVHAGAKGIVVPVPSVNDADNLAYFQDLCDALTDISIIVYNTETAFFQTYEGALAVANLDQVIAIKDSSDNISVFSEMCEQRTKGNFAASVLQGMEHRLNVPAGCDGYLISLLNTAPELCKEMWINNNSTVNKKILDIFWEYNLGGEWFVSQKAILKERGVIRSAEQFTQYIHIT
jgi:4-hydroxy-tetrahydrodipicolinate synthase